ncbi:unnamed protein product [Adineta steineri]|uniref:Uncharacterized protein n=1 Tax=Adineta steineri TaxID=433720 RepID=A0A818LFU0_9BILA|nr:unnamed protein product [Adineta steineri]CAF3568075.1 unnamed protein product [Adineta steineri]
MADIGSMLKHINPNNNSLANSELNDSSSIASTSSRSVSPNIGYTIKYKTIPKKTESKGIWDGYETKEEFMMMHLR